MFNSYYKLLLEHVAPHGFIAVAPQLGGITPNPGDSKDVDAAAARSLPCLPASPTSSTASSPSTDLSKLALALGLAKPTTPGFSGLVGVDPVAGLSKATQMDPKVLTFKPRSLHTGTPVLVLGTGLGPKHVTVPPCAPVGVNHAECLPPKYHFVLRDYGHLNMLDDGVSCVCERNLHDPKDLARRAIGGLMVDFLRDALQRNDKDLQDVLAHPDLAPAVLKPLQHEVPCMLSTSPE